MTTHKELINKIDKWLEMMLIEQPTADKYYLSVKVDLQGRLLDTNETIVSCDFNEGHIIERKGFISLDELKVIVK